MKAKLSGRMILALIVVVSLAAVGSAFAGAQGDDTRRGTDPLSSDELASAASDARAEGEPAPESQGANGLPDRVVLLVERHEEAKAADPDLRRADVYEYAYTDDTLTRSVVDLESGRVDETTSGQGTQLPLIDVESARAVEVLYADPAFSDRLATEFRAATGRELGDPDTDLDMQTIVFRADSMPTVAQGAAAQCGIERCAQFMIQSTDHTLINLFPLVNLSEGAVITTDGVVPG